MLGPGAIAFAPLIPRKIPGLLNPKTQKNPRQTKSHYKINGICFEQKMFAQKNFYSQNVIGTAVPLQLFRT